MPRLKPLQAILVIAALFSGITKPQPAQAELQTEEYVFRRSWGGEGNELNFPQGIALGNDNTIIVANSHNHRLTIISPQTRTFTNWGEAGSGPGEFNYPSGLATNINGEIYVADWGNARIQKLSPDGTFILQWGSKGIGNGQFDRPRDIALDSSGNVYVADLYNDRIQKFTSTGDYILQWGTEGAGTGQFASPEGIAIDLSNLIYIADSGNKRIQVFNENGLFIKQWAVIDSENNLQYPQDIGVNAYGEVFVAVPGTNQILVYDTSGNLTREIGGPDQFTNPWEITINASGELYVCDGWRIQKFSRYGDYLAQWGNPPLLDFPHSVSIDASGNVFVLTASEVWKFNNAGAKLLTFGSYGTGNSQFDDPARLAVSNTGFVYMTLLQKRPDKTTPNCTLLKRREV